MMPSRPWRWLLAPVAALALLALALTGCQTLEEMAPPVNAQVRGVGFRNGIDPAVLERGRQVYVTSCARCHAVTPVARYTPRQWPEIMARMAPLTKLTPRQTDDVTAYVLTAYQTLREK